MNCLALHVCIATCIAVCCLLFAVCCLLFVDTVLVILVINTHLYLYRSTVYDHGVTYLYRCTCTSTIYTQHTCVATCMYVVFLYRFTGYDIFIYHMHTESQLDWSVYPSVFFLACTWLFPPFMHSSTLDLSGPIS